MEVEVKVPRLSSNELDRDELARVGVRAGVVRKSSGRNVAKGAEAGEVASGERDEFNVDSDTVPRRCFCHSSWEKVDDDWTEPTEVDPDIDNFEAEEAKMLLSTTTRRRGNVDLLVEAEVEVDILLARGGVGPRC